MSDFLFPDVGEGITEGKLIAWKVAEGATVKRDQILCEVETDKAVVEIPAPQAGVVTKLHHAVGAVIKVGQPLVTFGDGGAASAPAPALVVASVSIPVAAPVSQPVSPVANEFKRPIESGTKKVESTLVPVPPTSLEHPPASATSALAPHTETTVPRRVLAAPSTRRLARERGIDIERVTGSGSGGRIMDADILAAAAGGALVPPAVRAPTTPATPVVESAAPAPLAAHPLSGNSVPYAGRRKAIGEHMVQSHAAPAVTEFAQADVSALMAIRDRLKQSAEQRGIKLTPLAFVAKATATMLLKHPLLNSELVANEIDAFGDVHLGIAMDTPKGLVVPVVRNAEHTSILGIASAIQTLAESARTDKLTMQQITGSTFSISSIGPLRVQGFTPMLNAPETAILGVGAIQDLPWVVNGVVVPRKIITLSLTFDHRVVDGAEAARFLTDLVLLLENPDALLVENS